MRERLAGYYRAIRSVRTSTWVLLVIAIGSNMLYYQVRPDPIDGGSRPGGTPVVTQPESDGAGQGSEPSTPVEQTVVETTVPATTVDTTDTTTTTVDTSTILPDADSTTVPEPSGSGEEPGDDQGTVPQASVPVDDNVPPVTG